MALAMPLIALKMIRNLKLVIPATATERKNFLVLKMKALLVMKMIKISVYIQTVSWFMFKR